MKQSMCSLKKQFQAVNQISTLAWNSHCSRYRKDKKVKGVEL